MTESIMIQGRAHAKLQHVDELIFVVGARKGADPHCHERVMFNPTEGPASHEMLKYVVRQTLLNPKRYARIFQEGHRSFFAVRLGGDG